MTHSFPTRRSSDLAGARGRRSAIRLGHGEFRDAEIDLWAAAVPYEPGGRQSGPGQDPLQKPSAVQTRPPGDQFQSSREPLRQRGDRPGRVTEDRIAERVGIIEDSLALQTLGVDRQTPPLSAVQDIVVMYVDGHHTAIPETRQRSAE